ncbi:hypothetical protein GA0070624_0655 [Micromonospora rhizosphaerae]|uniref:Uncharacterized protein n=1 Tax=Micromonospora rhizosphaerae TaxID=568872 RepID=A0A1C6RDP8_9ACTN|nr:hypothetical protein [Micromonospora rhizosphaerae]SCL15222.1 hypothetical protein GA0070624_0655 [Micromonospora rhizosphaerae]
MNRYPTLRWVAAATALCLVASGCGDEKRPAASSDSLTVASPPAVAAIPQLDLLDGKVFPIEAYKLTPEKFRQLNNAQTILANRCLSRFGFPPSLQQVPPTLPPDTSLSRRYGITDPATAAKYGYHQSAGDGAQASRPPAEPVSKELSLVLYGPPDQTGDANGNTGGTAHKGVEIPAGGCMGESKRKLNAAEYERIDPEQFAGDIELAAGKQADADPRVRGKFAEWSTCMKGKGFDYRDPFQPLDGDTLKTSLAQPTPTAVEIQTAVADVECKQQVNLVGVWFAVESAYEERLIEKNQERLAGIKRAIDAMLKAAAGVTG